MRIPEQLGDAMVASQPPNFESLQQQKLFLAHSAVHWGWLEAVLQCDLHFRIMSNIYCSPGQKKRGSLKVTLANKCFIIEVAHVTSSHNSLARPGHMVQPNGKEPESAILPCSQKADSRRDLVNSVDGNHKMPQWLGNSIFFVTALVHSQLSNLRYLRLFQYLFKAPEASVIQSVKKRLIQSVNPEKQNKTKCSVTPSMQFCFVFTQLTFDEWLSQGTTPHVSKWIANLGGHGRSCTFLF